MKRIKIKNISKQIICIIIVLMLCNFIMPTYSYAVETKDGGSFMKGIAQLLCFIPDVVFDFLQDMFVTPENIQLEDGTYSIKYSPGIIFSGQVPALDINFINPGESKEVSITYTEQLSLIEALDLNGAKQISEEQYKPGFKTKNGIIKSIKKSDKYDYQKDREIDLDILEGALKSKEFDNQFSFAGSTFDANEITLKCAWYNEDETKVYVIVDYYKSEQHQDLVTGNITYTNIGKILLYEMESKEALEGTTGAIGSVEHIYTKNYESSSGILQPIIATWYNVLRRIALVGLLSAIIYIGIRIVLTSTSAKDKAKYKNMLKDWLIAICLLFTLHYIMSITITVVDKINDVIKASSIASNGEDILMTSLRNKILNGNDWGVVLAYVLMYDVLLIFTIKYTIQYLKRLIHIGFLTTIAPIITLTYPLDKIKDSKSQAFDMWLKDYIFFTLIQVVHLLIYYIFVGCSIDLASRGNWVYAIVAIGFITPAEKLIRDMFGFTKKSKSIGTLTAAATGALATNALDKIQELAKSSTPKNEPSKAKNTKAIRMSNNSIIPKVAQNIEMPNVLTVGGKGIDKSNNTPINPDSRDVLENDESIETGHGFAQKDQSITNSLNGSKRTRSMGQALPNTNIPKPINNVEKETEEVQKEKQEKTAQKEKLGKKQDKVKMVNNKPKRNIKNGIKTVGKKYFPVVAKGTIRLMATTSGAIFGISKALVEGEEKNFISNITIGATTVDGIAQATVRLVEETGKIPEKVTQFLDELENESNAEILLENTKFDNIFKTRSEYEKLRTSTGFSRREFDKKIEKIVDAGIKDPTRIKKILKNHKKDSRRYSMENAIRYSQMAEQCSKDILKDQSKFIRFCLDRKITLTEEELDELRKDIINFK